MVTFTAYSPLGAVSRFVQRVLGPLGLIAGLFVVFITTSISAQGVTSGYATEDDGLRPGMAVVLSTSNASDRPLVERATLETADKVIGVMTTVEDSLVTVTSPESAVYVQTSGLVSGLASDVNGVIKKGDKVAVSPLKGILMRAEEGGRSLGTAVADFSGAGADSQTIKTTEGEKEVKIAQLAVTLDNNLGDASAATATGRSALERLGKAVAGRDVSELQVVVALIIFAIVMIAEGGIIYGAVSSSITSIGRNPLAKNLIAGELVRVLGIVALVLVVGLAAVYAVMLL